MLMNSAVLRERNTHSIVRLGALFCLGAAQLRGILLPPPKTTAPHEEDFLRISARSRAKTRSNAFFLQEFTTRCMVQAALQPRSA